MIDTKILLIASEIDEAGMNMVEGLKSIIEFEQVDFEVPNQWLDGKYKLYSSDRFQLLIMSNPHYQADYLQYGIEADLVIFLSKHLSKAGQKAILVHSLGNWDKARHNSGKDNSIALTSARAIYLGYQSLKEQQKKDVLDDYWVGIEATHHGPTELSQPAIFLEIGGTMDEWEDVKACQMVAKAVLKLIDRILDQTVQVPRTAIGIGGTHYCRAFVERLDAELFSISHVLPKYGVEAVTGEQLTKSWTSTVEEDKTFLLDKSGLNSNQRSKIENLLDQLSYTYEYTTDHPTS